MKNYSNEQVEILKNGIIGKTISLAKKEIECGGFKFNTSICENCTIIDVYQKECCWGNFIIIKAINKNGENRFFYIDECGNNSHNICVYDNDRDMIICDKEAFIQF